MSAAICEEGSEVIIHSIGPEPVASHLYNIVLEIGGVKATLTMDQWSYLLSHPTHHTARSPQEGCRVSAAICEEAA